MTIREYINETLQEPLRRYRTPIQDAILELMIEFFEEYHLKIEELPKIILPNRYRLDILDQIALSKGFSIRPEADLTEQMDILANISYVYKVRGSIYSIEHMKELYGGDLPSPVRVSIPSYNLFRYQISTYSGYDVYQDSDYYRPGVYEVHLEQYHGDIPKLIDWMYDELVASGALIYVKNKILTSEDPTLQDEGVISVPNEDPKDLFNSSLYLAVTDMQGHIVALKSIDEYKYIASAASTVRVLKYDSEEEGKAIYYIDMRDPASSITYGFSTSDTVEPTTWDTIDESGFVTGVDPTTSLWLTITKNGEEKVVPVILKDVGEDWYIHYTRHDGNLVDWVIWTSNEYPDPTKLQYTPDPLRARGLYIKASLTDNYPLCTYNKISLYKNAGGTADILKSSYYSERGEDEYTSLGTLVLTKNLDIPVTRYPSVTDVIELMLIMKE